MPRKRAPRSNNSDGVSDIRHTQARRKNNPPAGLATYEVRERQTTQYKYDPHLDPQLIWANKAGLKVQWSEIWDPDQTSFDVDVVSLHIHERVSTRAILEAVRRPEPQVSLFGETPLSADERIEFYRHDVEWVNRLILGDSLLVVNSLLVKEGLAGKVQMIYVDPPYAVNYASNFQARTDRRDVKDRDDDITHEPEQIKAYRDTWRLRVHSYLTYLRDRLLLCRNLLAESGSIFVQINDENVHLVRAVLDEVFDRGNFVSLITFAKTSGFQAGALPRSSDYLLWYAKDARVLKYRPLLVASDKLPEQGYRWLRFPDGNMRALTAAELQGDGEVPNSAERYTPDNLKSQGATSSPQNFQFRGRTFYPGPNSHWKTTVEGLYRLAAAERIHQAANSIRYVRLVSDYPLRELHNVWEDTSTGQFTEEKVYAVQTATKVIERCILMTTDPGDLVLDPTCGSGTTAWCAEKWGRRWITCDTSRVALAIARQRLMTARYEYYELKDPDRGVTGGFEYETVPHVTLESIAKNPEIDSISAKYQPQIDAALEQLNRATGEHWKEWEVPRGVETAWARAARTAHERFWALKGQKRREIDASIQRNAPQEVLYDRPKVNRGIVRVSGPFTVEAIPVPVLEDPSQASAATFEQEEARARVSDPGGDFLATMVGLLKQQGGVVFPGGKRMVLANVRPVNSGLLHAEAETAQNGKKLRVAVSFGPQYGPVTAPQVQESIPTAKVNAYDVLIFAGFSFDPEAQAFVQKAAVSGIQIHFANVAPDVLVGDLLKTNRASQIFTAFGQPDVALRRHKDDTYTVLLRGVDIYDPLTGDTQHAPGSDVAAWFLDTDYDGMTFHIAQAFFPGDPDAWEKLQRALKAQIDPDVFARMRGTESFPFKPGDHRRVAVKVIDFRGNEVLRVMALDQKAYARR